LIVPAIPFMLTIVLRQTEFLRSTTIVVADEIHRERASYPRKPHP